MGLLSLCGFAYGADSEGTNLAFKASPFSDTNDKAEFTQCGFVLEAEKPATRQQEGESFAVRLTTSEKYYSVVTAAVHKKWNEANWTPTPYIIQWVRVGDAPPIVLDPLNLITQRERGISSFTTTADKNAATLREFEKRNVPIWVKFYRYATDERPVYSGTAKVTDSAIAQFKQCMKSMSKS